MRIVIDMQGAQSESRFRSIGRYTIAFSKAIVRNRGEHEVILALSDLFPETIEPIRAAFDGLLPQENIRVWHAICPVLERHSRNDARREVAELIREAFLASLQPDIIHICSLFEGYVDNAVTSIGRFDTNTPVSVTLCDSITLSNLNRYLKPNLSFEEYYLRKIEHLKRANLYFSISETSRQESIQLLGQSESLFINGLVGAEAHFKPEVVVEVDAAKLREKFSLRRQFVLYNGGVGDLENLHRLIEGFAALPIDLRSRYQLLLAGEMADDNVVQFKRVAQRIGLGEDELCFTGYVNDQELVQLYNLCALYVFPSWHEGCGLLAALEAMQCGKAVIASNTSSLLEVIGRDDALFDPFDTNAITTKMAQVLSDDIFRVELERHGLEQARKFSWDDSACKAWQAFEASVNVEKKAVQISSQRPRLAYVSPLPPEASGISDYSAQLLPELAHYYRIEVIVAQEQMADPWVRANCPIRDVTWFRQHAHEFDRVLYHFGNSPFHSHMFGLLYDHPGVVVLHDFFLSNIVAHRDATGENLYGWARALQESHGWAALAARFQDQATADVVWAYPCNLQVLQDALGLIVHSDYSRQLAREWYGERAADSFRLVPLARKPAGESDRIRARCALGVGKNEFVVCSFGLLGPHKLNHRLLSAWLASPLAQDRKCRLVFVGQNHDGDYGAELVRNIRDAAGGSRIEITGWADSGIFSHWLAAADVGVQLRTLSRGETSAAVLDCMNYGLSTIVNANGSMAELDQNAVWMLPDEFDDSQLVEALTTLWSDRQRQVELGKRARQVIAKYHAPRHCAAIYAEAIEGYYQQAAVGIPGLLAAIVEQKPVLPSPEWPALAACVAKNVPPRPRRRQLLVDISALVETDLRTGIQRVVRAILMHWLLTPLSSWQIEPVYGITEAYGYRYARRFTSRFLGVSEDWAVDEIVEAYPGDVFFALDFHSGQVLRQAHVLGDWYRRGVGIHFLVYDLLPVLRPEVFPYGSQDMHKRWLETIVQFDGAICISRGVANELQAWLQMFGPKRERPYKVQWFYLGADPENSAPSTGMPTDAPQILAALQARPSFLSVGTIEPRKGHAQTLSALEVLWAQGDDVNLVLVGKQGWMVEALGERLRNHAKLGKRLFWLEGISDEYLEKVYAASTCLIAASEAEGFGLPLIEAAQHKLPIIARDIPVFREVAGGHAFYFENSKDPQVIAKAVAQWIELNASGQAPQSEKMPWLTWEESAKQLISLLGVTLQK
ncbi:glycosyltransferase [Nodosilinea sp. AN01ver1]|uniref:glycosyltransferase n=1 Tax=Nodosilinea sp. AN01ver1 TaxID=3423362 RepID=UPI003D314728